MIKTGGSQTSAEKRKEVLHMDLNLDVSMISDKLQVILPYLSYIINVFTKVMETMSSYFGLG